MRKAFLLAALLALAPLLPAHAAEKIGVVMLHGNGSNGSQFDDMRPVIEKAGYGLETPDMCWSDARRYSMTAEDCMSEVDKAIGKLKAKGFEKIVIAGHSMGGINAILYAANHKNYIGLIVYAPSSPPKGDNTNPNVAMARQLVRDGKGDTKIPFPAGINDIWASPRAYLSYVGQESPLYDKDLLPKISSPILWVLGTMDPGQADAADRYRYAPPTPLNDLITVKADHFATPDMAVNETVAWLDKLAAATATTAQAGN